MRARIDTAIGRVTIYRLVTLSLALLGALALLLSAAGQLSYRPFALLVTLATLLVVTLVSSRIFSLLFRAPAHTESSIITALLLFFILQPTTDLTTLEQIAVAALFATASKYLLAFRGRHVFNPAAVGAVWLTVLHFYLAIWWIGSPILLPATMLLALLVLYRTRRLPLAAVFVVVAGGILFSRGLSNGSDLTAAAKFAFAQTPLVFFAGFMLSEPLTLPPVRWQQLTVGAIVAVLFSVPITLGSYPVGPETALIVGNLVAFAFGQRRGIDLILTGKSRMSPSAVEFVFEPSRGLLFKPGQYLELSLPHRRPDTRGSRRAFSIASPPAQSSTIKLGMNMPVRMSSFKSALDRLPVGSTVRATGISGDFLLPRDFTAPLLLVAGGIGITPFISQLGASVVGRRRDVVLLYAPGNSGELPYRRELEAAGIRTVLVSAHRYSSLPESFESVDGRLDVDLISATVPDIARRHVFVSGSPALVDSVSGAVRALKAKSIRKDYFNGY